MISAPFLLFHINIFKYPTKYAQPFPTSTLLLKFAVQLKIMSEPTVETAVELGLLPEEFEQIKAYMGRVPNFTELSKFC